MMIDSDNPSRTYRTRHPMLLGFLAGSVFGVGVSLAVAMFVNRVASPFVHKQSAANGTNAARQAANATATAAPAADKPGDKPAGAAPNPQEQMSAVAGPAAMVAPSAPAAKSAKPAAAGAPANPANAAAPGGRYFLQVGSFVAAVDADNRKAKLALLGFEARVRAVQVPEKGTVHRVIVGPFATAAEMEEAKAELAANSYASSLISRQALASGQ
jgi:cell division protein FtsN